MSDSVTRSGWVGPSPQTIPNNPCFACGPANERGLKLDIRNDGAVTYTEFAADESWQGYGGVMHGGLIATVLDEVMAWEILGYGDLAVTAKLEVTYHQPIPTGRPLRATARLTESRGRARRVSAEIRDTGGTLLASANALFLRVPMPNDQA